MAEVRNGPPTNWNPNGCVNSDSLYNPCYYVGAGYFYFMTSSFNQGDRIYAVSFEEILSKNHDNLRNKTNI